MSQCTHDNTTCHTQKTMDINPISCRHIILLEEVNVFEQDNTHPQPISTYSGYIVLATSNVQTGNLSKRIVQSS